MDNKVIENFFEAAASVPEQKRRADEDRKRESAEHTEKVLHKKEALRAIYDKSLAPVVQKLVNLPEKDSKKFRVKVEEHENSLSIEIEYSYRSPFKEGRPAGDKIPFFPRQSIVLVVFDENKIIHRSGGVLDKNGIQDTTHGGIHFENAPEALLDLAYWVGSVAPDRVEELRRLAKPPAPEPLQVPKAVPRQQETPATPASLPKIPAPAPKSEPKPEKKGWRKFFRF